MSNIWAKNPDLFLYTKGNDVYLWRCNKTTWMPMISQDFDVVAKITHHQALIGNDDSLIAWNEKYYDGLIAYISSRRLLVNSQGLVIAELRKFGQDGKLDVNDQLPFYIRSLDVLSLKPYNLRDKTIPSRMVRYLGGQGRAAPVEDSTVSSGSITTTSTRFPPLNDHDVKRAALEKQVAELVAVNKTLTSDNTELKEVNKTLKKQATDLNDRNKALAEDVAAQTAKAASTLLQLMVMKRDKEAAEKLATDLNDRNKALAEDVAAQTAEAPNALTKLMVARRDKEAAEKLATDLNDRNKALAEDVAAQKAEAPNALMKLMVARRDKEAAEKLATDLNDRNKALADDVAAQKAEAPNALMKLMVARRDKEAAEKLATDLNDRNKALADDVAAQKAEAPNALMKLMVARRDKEAAEKLATDLNDRNKALADDVAAQKTEAPNALMKLMVARRDKEAAEKLATDLNDRNKALADDVAAQTAKAANILVKLMVAKRDKEAAETKAASLQIQIDNNKKEGWMNDLSDESGSWLHAEFLQPYIHRGVSVGADNAFRVVVVERGTSTEDDNTTNVHASYIYRVKIIDNVDINIQRATKEYRAVKLEDLNPSKEKARFCIRSWVRLVYNGDIYVIKETLASCLVQTILSRRC